MRPPPRPSALGPRPRCGARALGAVALGALLLGACRPSEPGPAGDPAARPAAAADSAPRLRPDARLDTLYRAAPWTFVVLDGARGDTVRHDPARARTRRLPASTYKVPHALLALESGVAPDTGFALPWDSVRYPAGAWWPPAWRRTQTLGGALRVSAVPYYRALAGRIGRARAQAWLDTLGYGNRAMGPETDRYWLDGSLTISPDEQAAFLHRLWTDRLPAAPAHQAAVRAFMRLGTAGGAVLSGKTGTASDAAGEAGWFVGVVERGGGVYPFALRVDTPPGADGPTREARRALAEAALRAVGVWP